MYEERNRVTGLVSALVMQAGPMAVACEDVLLSRRRLLGPQLVFASPLVVADVAIGLHRSTLAKVVSGLEKAANTQGRTVKELLEGYGGEFAKNSMPYVELGRAFNRLAGEKSQGQ